MSHKILLILSTILLTTNVGGCQSSFLTPSTPLASDEEPEVVIEYDVPAPMAVEMQDRMIVSATTKTAAADVFWPECNQGVGVTWRDPETKRAQRWTIFPCEETWYYRYEDYQGSDDGTIWYETKLREIWYDAPPEMQREFRKLLLYARDMKPFPTYEEGDGEAPAPREAPERIE